MKRSSRSPLLCAVVLAGCPTSSPSPFTPAPDAPPSSPVFDAGAASDAGPPGDAAAAEVLLEATFGSGLHAYTVDPRTGALSEAAASPVDPHGILYGVAVAPGGRDVYAIDITTNLLLGFRRAPGGAGLTPLEPPSVATGRLPKVVAVNPLGRFVYVGSVGGRLSLFARGVSDGSLAEIEPPLSLGSEIAAVAPDAAGRFVYVQTFAGVHTFAVGATGTLDELEGSPLQVGDGGALVLHPSGKLLFNGGGALNVLAIDPASGALHPVDGSPFTNDVGSEDGALDLAVDPRGRFVYAVHSATGHVSGFAVEAETGQLRAVPRSPVDTRPSPYSLAVEPGGSFLYVGHDDADFIATYAIDQESGALLGVDPPRMAPRAVQPQLVFVP